MSGLVAQLRTALAEPADFSSVLAGAWTGLSAAELAELTGVDVAAAGRRLVDAGLVTS